MANVFHLAFDGSVSLFIIERLSNLRVVPTFELDDMEQVSIFVGRRQEARALTERLSPGEIKVAAAIKTDRDIA